MKKIKDVLDKIKEKYNKSEVIKKINLKNHKENPKKINYKDLSVSMVEQELKREKYKLRYKKVLASTVYTLIIVVSIAVIIAVMLMPVLEISGSSMKPTFEDGEIVVSIKNKQINQGDIIAFYHGNKILIKRVIALPGSYVSIDEDGYVYVDNKLLNEDYVIERSLGNVSIEFPYQVPEETYFVLGDARETSVDSRSSTIGTISQDDVIGKIIFRVWPIKKIGIIN